MKRLLLLLAPLLIAAPAAASPDLPEGKWWKRPRVAAEIGLTREQTEEIERIFVRARGRLIDRKAELEKRQGELQDSIEDESADRESIAEKVDAVENARAELQKTRALMLIDMKRVLRQDQWERLKEIQQAARRATEQRRMRLRELERQERREMRQRPPGERRPPSDRVPPASPPD